MKRENKDGKKIIAHSTHTHLLRKKNLVRAVYDFVTPISTFLLVSYADQLGGYNFKQIWLKLCNF